VIACHRLTWAVVRPMYFFKLLEYFVDTSVIEGSESVWCRRSCRNELYGLRSQSTLLSSDERWFSMSHRSRGIGS
jgi:hypothetical protein